MQVWSLQDPLFSLFPGSWPVDTSFFSPWSLTGMQRNQQQAFDEWKGQITLALHASSINRDIWFATIISYLGKEGFKWWNTLTISTNEEAQKDLGKVFKAITDTLEVSTSYWNHINEIYSDIKQGDNESTDHLDQRIKNLIERCQYSTEEKLVCRTELLFHATKYFEVKKWVRSKKWREDMTYQALLQYTKEHEMTVKDFNRHKLNGGIAQPMTVDAIKMFKHNGKKGTRTSGSHRTSGQSTRNSKTCSKCNTTHQFKDCPAFGKKCHKCGFKNHFSLCCRSSWSNRQDSDWHRGRTPAHGRSTERHHRPSRGRHSRSKSCSRSGSQTRNAHSIEIDQYDIDNIDVLRTFHSISSSRSVAAISNDSDPDGKMKILMKLWVKLPYWNIADVMEVKVNDRAEVNILPLHTFRSMFPHKLDEDGYPKDDALIGSKTTLQCYDDGKLVNHGMITLRLKHYMKDSFQDHQSFVVETPTQKKIIIGHPASARLGLIQVLCKNHAKTMSSIETMQTNNLFQVHNIDGKTWRSKQSSSEAKSGRRSKSESFQDPLSRPKSVTGQNECERTEMNSFQDPRHQTEHLYSKNTHIQSKSSSFQDHNPWWQEEKWQNKLISRPLIQSIMKQVKELNPKYYLPTNKQTQIISEPARALRDWPQEESTEAPLQASRFNPIYMEPGSIRINSTRDLQTLYPNSFNWIGDMSGEYDIKTDPRVPPVQHGRHKVPMKPKVEIEKELNEKVHQGVIVTQTEPTPWISSLMYLKKPNSKLRICLDPKDLNKAIIQEHHKAPTLEEIAHILTRATIFSKVDGNKAFFGMHLTEQVSLLTSFNTHLHRYQFLHVPFGLKMSQDIFQMQMDDSVAQFPGILTIHDDVLINSKDDKDHDTNLVNLFNVAQKEGLVFNSTKCAIKKESVTFFGGVF